MQSALRTAIAVFAVSIAAAFGQVVSDLPAQALKISGRIVGETGSPLAGQGVDFRPPGSSTLGSVKTDPDGRFSFPAKPRTQYELSVPYYKEILPAIQSVAP